MGLKGLQYLLKLGRVKSLVCIDGKLRKILSVEHCFLWWSMAKCLRKLQIKETLLDAQSFPLFAISSNKSFLLPQLD